MRKLLAVAVAVAGLAFVSSAQASCSTATNYAMFTSYNTALFLVTAYGPAGHTHTISDVQNEGCFVQRSPQDAYWSWADTDNQTGVIRSIYMQAWVYGGPGWAPGGAYDLGLIHWIRRGPTHADRLNSGLVDTPGF